ncbi:MAG: tyrosine-type recombinase/integrase [Thermodesulfobacteriota bacterium]
MGHTYLDDLRSAHLVGLQRNLVDRGLAKASVDNIVHSALRSLLRAARVAGYPIPDLRQLYDKDFVRRLASAQEPDIDPYTAEERDSIVEHYATSRRHFYAFIFFRFWTGTRPGEAIGLRWGDVDFARQVARIRRSRVLGHDGETKTRKSRREVVLHEVVIDVLREIKPPAGPRRLRLHDASGHSGR